MRKPCAFTLVELLVVMGVIAVLIALLLPTLSGARKSARAVECKAQLRELFAAQNFYADDNDGRYVIGTVTGNARWEAQLEKYLTQRSGDHARVYHCPSLAPERATMKASSYGVNPSIRMPFWNAQRHRKMDAARIIFMGDKAATGDDFLTSDDGYYFHHPRPTVQPGWVLSLQHSGRTSLRHGKDNLANMVMADGHVESMPAPQLVRESGAWYVRSTDYPLSFVNGVCCP